MAFRRFTKAGLAFLAATALAAPAPQIPNDQVAENPKLPANVAGGALYATRSLVGPIQSIGSTTAAGADAAATLPASEIMLVQNQQAPAADGLILDFSNIETPQPIRGSNGDIDAGPHSDAYQRLNPNQLARPGTDAGSVPNAKWPMALSSARSGTGQNSGWARQQTVNEMPIAKAMAGVDMKLAPNAYRELHWHSANEWSYIFNGSVRVSAVNQNGEVFVDDLQAGDLWFFPAGVPHSIQASNEGVEFLLVFDQGDFSEDDTDLVTELFLRNPREVLAKNFQTSVEEVAKSPTDQKYIFKGTPYNGTVDMTINELTSTANSAGTVPRDQYYSYHLSQQQALEVPGGTVKIADPTVFPIASNFAMALFTIEPGAMREIHWHLTSDEWNFFIAGNARVTSFASQSSRTFDFTAGDVGYIPVASGHYVENTGNTTVIYLEVLQAPKYQDISAAQWLGLTPKQVVKDTLGLSDAFIDNLPKAKQYIVPGNANYSTTNFTVTNANAKRELKYGKRGADVVGEPLAWTRPKAVEQL